MSSVKMWKICQLHWDELRVDLKDYGLLLANTLAMYMLADETKVKSNPDTPKCPICENPKGPDETYKAIIKEVNKAKLKT